MKTVRMILAVIALMIGLSGCAALGKTDKPTKSSKAAKSPWKQVYGEPCKDHGNQPTLTVLHGGVIIAACPDGTIWKREI